MQLSKSYEEKSSNVESLNIELLETKSKLATIEHNLKEKEERLASNDKGNSALYHLIIITIKVHNISKTVIHWLNSKLNNCEITAKSSSNNCGVLSETTNINKNMNPPSKSGEKFSTSTPATIESV